MALIAHWPLNGNTNDISGNNWNGTLKGSPTYVNGKIGQAISLNGSTQYVDIPTREYLKWRGQEFSVFLWVNLSSDDSDGSIISKPWNGGGQYNYRIYNGTNNIGVYLLGTQDYSLATPSGSIIKDVWNHIGFTVNSTTLKIYINGVKVSEANHGITAWVPSAGDNTESLAIGTLYPYGTFNQPTHAVKGLFNDVRLYDHVLADFEVRELARAKILHYTFDDMQEPTTNLNYNPTPSTWVNSGAWTSDYNENDVERPFPNSLLSIWSGVVTTVGSIHFGFNTTTILPSTTYTISVWFRQSRAGASSPYMRTAVNNNNIGSFSYNGDTNSANWPVNQWIRITATGITQSNETGIYLSNYIGTQIGDKIWYYGYQVEKKGYATPYVYGSRTGQVKDYSGFFNHSDSLLEADTPKWSIDTKVGIGSYLFSNKKITGPGPFTIATDKLTLCAWVKPLGAHSDDRGIVIQQNGNYYLTVTPTQQVSVYWYDTSNPGYHTTTETLTLNTWSHIATVWDGTNNIIYINGAAVKTTTVATPGRAIGGSPLTIGRETTNRQFNGYITEVRQYATALSSNDILDLYQTRAQIEETGVLYAKEFLSNAEETINLHGDPILINTYVEDQAVSKSNWGVDGTLFARKSTAPEAPANALMLEMNITSAGSGGLYTDLSRGNGLEYTLIEGKTYTRSWWVKCSDTRSISGHVCSSNRASDNNYIVGGSITVTPEWQKFSHTFTVGVGQGGSYHTRHIIYNEIFSVWVANIQIEEKSYYTPFVTTFRPVVDLPSTIAFAANEVHETGTANFEDFSTVGITDGLIGYWPFNGNTIDYSGNQYDGVEYSAGVSPIINYDNIEFQTGDGLKVENIISAIDRKPFSIIILAEVISHSGTPRLAMGYPDNTLELNVRSTFSGITLRDSGGYRSANYNATIPVNEKFLYTGTFDGSTLKYYHNGEYQAQYLNHLNDVTFGDHLLFGNWTSLTQSFQGKIYYAKIFNRALTAEEIKIEYNTMLNNEVQIHESGIVYAKDLIQY